MQSIYARGLLEKQEHQTTQTGFKKTQLLVCCNIAEMRHEEKSIPSHALVPI